MANGALTIVAALSTRSHITKKGVVDYTTTHTKPEVLDFHVKDGRLKLAHAVVENPIFDGNGVLTIKEVLANGDKFETTFHLKDPEASQVAFERFWIENKKGG